MSAYERACNTLCVYDWLDTALSCTVCLCTWLDMPPPPSECTSFCSCMRTRMCVRVKAWALIARCRPSLCAYMCVHVCVQGFTGVVLQLVERVLTGLMGLSQDTDYLHTRYGAHTHTHTRARAHTTDRSPHCTVRMLHSQEECRSCRWGVAQRRNSRLCVCVCVCVCHAGMG